jgi:hypothetical protein
MDKQIAVKYSSELKAKAISVVDVCSHVNNEKLEDWQRAEAFVLGVLSYIHDDFLIDDIIKSTRESLISIIDVGVHSRTSRSCETPPLLSAWILSSRIKNLNNLEFILDDRSLELVSKNIDESKSRPLAGRCGVDDERSINVLLLKGIYSSNSELQVAYSEFVSARITKPEQDSTFSILKTFTDISHELSSHKIFGKSANELLDDHGHEKTSSRFFSESINKIGLSIASSFSEEEKVNIKSILTINNSL